MHALSSLSTVINRSQILDCVRKAAYSPAANGGRVFGTCPSFQLVLNKRQGTFSPVFNAVKSLSTDYSTDLLQTAFVPTRTTRFRTLEHLCCRSRHWVVGRGRAFGRPLYAPKSQRFPNIIRIVLLATLKTGQTCWYTPLIPTLRQQRQANLSDLEASLVYTGSSRPCRAIGKDFVSNVKIKQKLIRIIIEFIK